MDATISPSSLIAARASIAAPLVIDVRREQAFAQATDTVAGALRRDPERWSEWVDELPRNASVVVYCAHGHEVSQTAARALRERGLKAQFLERGIEGWREADGPLQIKPLGGRTCWVTRARPKIDRIACPWLVARFVDRHAEFVYAPMAEIPAIARKRSAIPFDTTGAQFGHVGDECSFDAFVRRYALGSDPALRRLADIVRGADTGRLAATPESAGLLAVSTGLSQLCRDDHAMLSFGMRIYDALYRWCQADVPDGISWHVDGVGE